MYKFLEGTLVLYVLKTSNKEKQVVDEEEFKKEMTNPSLELKVLPTHLKYTFLETDNFLWLFLLI